MKNLFLILFHTICLSIYGQISISNRKDYSIPNPPADTTSKIFSGKFTTKNLYGCEKISDDSLLNLYSVNDVIINDLYFSSDSFINETINNFIVDNPSNPTELIFNDSFKIKLNSINFLLHSNYHFYDNCDSSKYFETEYDFNLTLNYHNNFIESIIFDFSKITDKSYQLSQRWYKSTSMDENIDVNDKEKILSMWINKIFIKDLYKLLPDKKYSENLIKYGNFSFYYTIENAVGVGNVLDDRFYTHYGTLRR